MYKQKDLVEEITFNLNLISTVIESLNKINLYDLNIYSEDFFCKLLNITYGFNLENLNIQKKNTASIDLADKNKKICYQVTSTNTSTKIKNTIEKFEKYNLFNDYDELFIFLLTKKEQNYSSFKTNQKYKFSKNNIHDINTLIADIKNKSIREIEEIAIYISSNVAIFSKLSFAKTSAKVENRINDIVSSLKQNARERYSLTLDLINTIIDKYDKKYYFQQEFENFEYMKTAYDAALFFNLIDNDQMSELTKFIEIHTNVRSKFAQQMVISHYNYMNNAKIGAYLLENIIRILEGLKNILMSEINVNYSSGFGDKKVLYKNNSLFVAVSNEIKNDHKILVLETNKNEIIDSIYCFGGISESVNKIKSHKFRNDLYISGLGFHHIYIWNPNISYDPFIICSDKNSKEKIIDYEICSENDSLVIIASTNNNKLIVWKMINNHSFIYQQAFLKESAYILLNIDGINKLITTDSSSKKIYKYEFEENDLCQYYVIPEIYERIRSLTIHPFKEQIGFSFSLKNKIVEGFELNQCEFDKIIQLDIKTTSAFFNSDLKGHFVIDVKYELFDDKVHFVIYDRDGAGSQYTPLVKIWKENLDKNFDLVYSYDEYPIEKNVYFSFMKFCKNNLFVNTTEDSAHINILKGNQEIQFYKLHQGYVIRDIFCHEVES